MPEGVTSDLAALKQILFGAELARLNDTLAADRDAAGARAGALEQRVDRAVADLEQRVGTRLEELAQRVSAQLADLSQRQQSHAERATQLLDQVMAELSRRTETLTAETRAGLEELRARTADIERRKLNVAEFGSSLAALGQRYAGGEGGSA